MKSIALPQTISRSFYLRLFFWTLGLLLAFAQDWSFRHYMSADAISYLDMSDAFLSDYPWSRLINGVWSPLYPLLIGMERRLLNPSPQQEIPFAHHLNIVLFVFAFIAFEFLLHSLESKPMQDVNTQENSSIKYLWLTMAYSLFLWASLAQITLKTLRPDMLMSAFVYLATGLMLQLRAEEANWIKYVLMGTVVGVGYLAKAPMLPFGFFILLISSAIVADWRKAAVPTLCSSVLAIAIGSVYFVPLSLERGHVTFGESARFNYLIHVDRVSPPWYIQDLGAASGRFLHPPTKIVSSPPTYTFPSSARVTHAGRFDPSYLSEGAQPRVRLRNQVAAIRRNLRILYRILAQSVGVLVLVLLLLLDADTRAGAFYQWPLWLSGVMGLSMYLVVHVEHRYVGVFVVLFWLGLVAGMKPRGLINAVFGNTLIVAISMSLFVPLVKDIEHDVMNALRLREHDTGIQVGVMLTKLGVCAGDPVARISPMVTDLTWARVSRTTIISEVDYEAANHFWKDSPETQMQVLHAMAASAAKVVVAHDPENVSAHDGWEKLGTTPFWVHLLVAPEELTCKH